MQKDEKDLLKVNSNTEENETIGSILNEEYKEDHGKSLKIEEIKPKKRTRKKKVENNTEEQVVDLSTLKASEATFSQIAELHKKKRKPRAKKNAEVGLVASSLDELSDLDKSKLVKVYSYTSKEYEESLLKESESKKESLEKDSIDIALEDNLNKFKILEERLLEQQNLQEHELIAQLYENETNKYWKIEDNLFLRQNLESITTYPANVNGIVFIGDPHLWSKRPGRRLDENFTTTVINKLKEIVHYCNKHSYLAVFKGDIFEQANDNNNAMLIELIKVLKGFKYKSISLIGNHDIKEYRLTDNEPLKLLETAGLLYLIEDNGFAFKVNIKKGKEIKTVLLGGTPYGQPIPDNVMPFITQSIDLDEVNVKEIYQPLTEEQRAEIAKQEELNYTTGNLPIYLSSQFNKAKREEVVKFKLENNIDSIIWLTHHDLAMNGAYPNSIALKEILGVDYVVNGHIHGTKTSVLIGNTAYYNKGNITRSKIDMIDHKPAVWLFDPFNEEKETTLSATFVKKLIPFYLTIKDGKDIFRLTGKHAGKESLTEEDLAIYKESLDIADDEEEQIFASLLLQVNQEQDSSKTDDGAIIQESLMDFIEQEEAPENLKQMILSLSQRAIQKQ